MIWAASASPSDRMTEACRSCSERSTTNLARSASESETKERQFSLWNQILMMQLWRIRLTLLSDLLLLNRLCELLSEGKMRLQ